MAWQIYIGWLVLLLVLLLGSAHVANKIRTGDPFSIWERLLALYAMIALAAWLYAGYRGLAPIPAALEALGWPVYAVRWLITQGRSITTR
jgi:hypothetical protein